MKPILIGIAGGSASGKSSIAQRLKEEFRCGIYLSLRKELTEKYVST